MPALTYLQKVSEAIEVSIHQSLLLRMALQCLSSEEKEQQLIRAISIYDSSLLSMVITFPQAEPLI